MHNDVADWSRTKQSLGVQPTQAQARQPLQRTSVIPLRDASHMRMWP